MNDAKTETIFDERDALQRDNERLLTAFENKTLECVGLRDQLEAARKVADAAVAAEIAHNAFLHCIEDQLGVVYNGAVVPLPGESGREIEALLFEAEYWSRVALDDAVREYRKLTVPPPLEEAENDARRDRRDGGRAGT